MNTLILIFVVVSITGCKVMSDFEKSDKVNAEYEAMKQKIHAEAKQRAENEEAEIKACENMIYDCRSKTTKEKLLKCREDLKPCEYTFKSLNNQRGKQGEAGIEEIHGKCFTYGYEKLRKTPKYVVSAWSLSDRGHGEFKSLDECIEAKDNDPQRLTPSPSCIQHDWCKDQNSLIIKN